jgi:hypothetical protein
MTIKECEERHPNITYAEGFYEKLCDIMEIQIRKHIEEFEARQVEERGTDVSEKRF